MDRSPEKLALVAPESAASENLKSALQDAGYEVAWFAAVHEGLEAVRQPDVGLLLLDASSDVSSASEAIAIVRGSAATENVRVILLTGPDAGDRAAGLDLGADDALSAPADPAEVVARVRAQCRALRAEAQLRDRARISDEGQQIAYTAFEALAVTEKMTSDAVSLDRRLKFGVAAVFVAAALMAGIYFLFARTAHKETVRSNATIARLEGGLMHQQDLIVQARKLRTKEAGSSNQPASKDELQKKAADLKAKMSTADSNEVAALQKQLDETNIRLKRIEQNSDAAERLIAQDVPSVCLLHVAVAFNNQKTGQRLRYAGLNSQGEPLQDSDGNPILTLEGRGPEVMLDVFGTGFLVGSGRLLTNRHVAEPWWKNDEIKDLTSQGFQAQISSIHAYFPGEKHGLAAEIQEISQEADLATMRIDDADLKRASLAVDSGPAAAVRGEPVVSVGYATGLAAILARTDEDTAQQILTQSGGNVSDVLEELSRRDLIRPLVTQGHIGDILPGKIVFDAQTTSGGSGGPLFNHQGKVIGVTFAVLTGFGGSNFGIPIRLSQPLLTQ